MNLLRDPFVVKLERNEVKSVQVVRRSHAQGYCSLRLDIVPNLRENSPLIRQQLRDHHPNLPTRPAEHPRIARRRDSFAQTSASTPERRSLLRTTSASTALPGSREFPAFYIVSECAFPGSSSRMIRSRQRSTPPSSSVSRRSHVFSTFRTLRL